jgi:hypothetical protein
MKERAEEREKERGEEEEVPSLTRRWQRESEERH